MSNPTENAVSRFVVGQVEETFKTGARFAAITYTNAEGETARHNLLMGVKLERLYRQDLATLTNLRPTLSGLALTACDELIASLQNSLTKGIGNNDNYTLKGYYTPITPNGEVKLHVKDGKTFLYIRGYRVGKKVLTEGVYKKVNSRPLTIEKDKLRKLLKTNRIKTFSIDAEKIGKIAANGMTVEIN